MQPETQNNPQQPTSSYSKVPDYLHLDPIQEPAKPGNGRKIILFVLMFVVVAGAGATLFAWMQDAPKRQLHSALEVMMQTSYVSREIDAESSSPQSKTNIQVRSDFSQPSKPKSSYSYDFSIGLDANDAASNSKVAGEIFAFDQSRQVGRLTTAAPSWVKGLTNGQWYSSEGTEIPKQNPDVLQLRNVINNPLSVIPLGNFNADHRTEILNFIQTNELYAITGHRTNDASAEGNNVLQLQVDYKKLGTLADKLNDLLKIKTEKPTVTTVNQVEFWVDGKTNKLVRVIESIRQGDLLTVKSVTKFQYPNEINIEVPNEESAKR